MTDAAPDELAQDKLELEQLAGEVARQERPENAPLALRLRTLTTRHGDELVEELQRLYAAAVQKAREEFLAAPTKPDVVDEKRDEAITWVMRSGYTRAKAEKIVDQEGVERILRDKRSGYPRLDDARADRLPRPRWEGACPAGEACREPSCLEHGEAPCGESCEDPACVLHAPEPKKPRRSLDRR